MDHFNCPHCGRLIGTTKHETSYGVPLTRMRPMADSIRRVGDATQSTASEYTEATRRSQSRAPNKDADVTVPFWRTLGTMGFIGLPAAIGIAWGNEYPFRDFLITFSSVSGASWLVFTSLSEASIWVFEKMTNTDVNKDGHIGKPPPLRVEVEDHEDGRDSEIWADLPVPNSTRHAGAISFAKAIVFQGDSFSERTAAEYGYTRTEWQDFRDVFIRNGWAVWNHPDSEQQGVTLLSGGKPPLRRIAREGVPREEWLAE